VIADGKKICGILTEMSVRDGGIEYVIVGVGVNVNTPAFDGELFDKATSLMLMTGRSFDLCELAALIMDHFETLYETFLNRRDLGFIRDEYDSLLVSRGKKVRILDPKGDLEGVSLGINDRGELLVELSDGSVRNIYAGEVSVRGVYGYV
jgi:BirA family biotin operon repressor/biotin-[acetyl-CoA-carboxylase] ligase